MRAMPRCTLAARRCTPKKDAIGVQRQSETVQRDVPRVGRRALPLRFRPGALPQDEALVEQRYQNERHAEAEEGEDAVAAFQSRKIIEENLGHGEQEEAEGEDAQRAHLPPETQQEQSHGVDSPGHGDGEVAGELALQAELHETRGREVVEDLEIDQGEDQDQAEEGGCRRHARPISGENVLLRSVSPRGLGPPQQQGAEEAAEGRHAVGVEQPVEDRQAALLVAQHRRIRQQPHAHAGIEREAEVLEPRVRQPAEEPPDGRSFESPGDGDPLPVELQRNRQRDETHGDGGEEGQVSQAPARLRSPFRRGGEEAGDTRDGRDGDHRQDQRQRADVRLAPAELDRLVERQEEGRAGQRGADPRRPPLLPLRSRGGSEREGKREERQVEDGVDRQRQGEVLGRVEIARLPGHGEERGEEESDGDEPAPIPPPGRDDQQDGVEREGGEERARIPLQAPPDQTQQAEAGDESGADDARLVLPGVHPRTGTQAGDDRQHDGEEQRHGEVAPQRRAGRAVLEPDLDQDGESDRAAGRHAGQAPLPAALDEERRERGEQDDENPRRSRRRHPHHQDEGVEPEAESRRDPRDLISLAVLFQPSRREPGRQPRWRVEQRREADRRERRPPERRTRALSRPERQSETRGQGAADQQEAAAAEQRDGDERRVEQREIAEEQRPLAGVGLVPAQEESQDERHGGSRGGALQQRRRLLLLREHRQEEVEQAEEQEDEQADDLLLRRQELLRPADLDEEGAQQTQYHEPMPALPHGDGHETEVEQQDVGEEAQGPVLAGRQQDWRGEAAEEAQDRAEDRVVADGDDAGHDGDQGHHQERHPERQEVP